MALGSAMLPESLRTSGLAVLTTALSMGRLAASGIFGLVWTGFGMEWALPVFPTALAVALAVIAITRPREATA